MTVVDGLVERIRRIPPIVADGAIGAVIIAIGIVEVLLWNDSTNPTSQRPEALAILAVGALGVTLRRTNLWLAYALVQLAALGGLFWTNGASSMGLTELILLYTVAELSGAVVSLLALVASGVMAYLSFGYLELNLSRDLPDFLLNNFPYMLLAWLAGRAQARRRAITSDLQRNSVMLREEQNRLARSAVATERARIARELHALVVRGIEQMNSETRAARAHLVDDSLRACEWIGAIETTGRASLVEMRRLLMVLRTRKEAAAPSSTDGATRADGSALSPSDHELPSAPSLMARRWTLAPALTERGRSWVATPWVADALVVLVVAILAVVERFSSVGFMHRPIDVVLAAIVVVALLFRRLTPLVVLAVVASVIFASTAFLTTETVTADRAMLVAVFTVAALRSPWWGVAAIGAEVVAYVPLLRSYFPGTASISIGVATLVGWTAMFVFAVIAGTAVRDGRRLNEQLREKTEMLRRTREERVRRAVDEERSRVARDVHDMVAHGVTLMVIQAGAARWLAESDPAKATRALQSVERAGQEALRELQSLLGSLSGASPYGDEPLPLDEPFTIRSLIDEAVRSGMRIELIIDGEPHQLEAGLEISLYRIVQEALTNIRKHASGARVWIELLYTPEEVEVEVIDSGGQNGAEPQEVPGAGQGLVGIAERAALFGGLAEAGPTPEGGFRVRASLVQERVLV